MYITVLKSNYIIITHFADQEIDGDTFLSLTGDDINEITKKIGIRKKLEKLQAEVCLI